jgi:large subunit ribosomal protein L5
MPQRLKNFYQKMVVPKLRNEFHYQNIHQVPRIEKVVINQGLGEKIQHSKTLSSSRLELTTIAAQSATVTNATSSIAGFKIRRKIPVGIMVTLRGERIYAFFDRLINLAIPRIRDFQGVREKSFDGRGNYNVGFKEQLIFPEIIYDEVDQIRGIDISIITNSISDKERFSLLKEIGIPFKKKIFYFL